MLVQRLSLSKHEDHAKINYISRINTSHTFLTIERAKWSDSVRVIITESEILKIS